MNHKKKLVLHLKPLLENTRKESVATPTISEDGEQIKNEEDEDFVKLIMMMEKISISKEGKTKENL